MALRYGKLIFIESLDQIGADPKVGVSIEGDKEYYFITSKDSNGEYRRSLNIYSCEAGAAVGDLIGSTDPIPGIPTAEKVISSYEETYLGIKRWIQSLNEELDRTKLVNSVFLMSGKVLYGRVTDQPFEKNLLALPLFVEVISGCVKYGIEYNFKNSDKILSSLRKYQKLLSVFAKEVMLYDKNSDPAVTLTRIDHTRIPKVSYSGCTTLICNDLDSQSRLTEAFIPDTFDDLISYLVNRYSLNYHFYCCANCRRYFAFRTDTKNKSCTRVIESAHYFKDIGRTCRDVGRLRSHVRGLYSNETHALYQRNYKATFARKMKGKISEEHFAAWSRKARRMRDKCLNGIISYDELEQWFFDHYLRE